MDIQNTTLLASRWDPLSGTIYALELPTDQAEAGLQLGPQPYLDPPSVVCFSPYSFHPRSALSKIDEYQNLDKSCTPWERSIRQCLQQNYIV